MRILVGKVFGIGNACLAVPMIKALASMGHDVDILVGDGPDDFGAHEVFRELRRRGDEPVVSKIYQGSVPFQVEIHDLAIMAIPYDGRWKNGLDFFAYKVMDSRRRPGDVERLGFDMWKKHEVEYMMENARELGFTGETPDGSFLERSPSDPEAVYLGIGYKRDPGGFGKSKHFGNESFSHLISRIRDIRPSVRFVSSGPLPDLQNAQQIGSSLSFTFSLACPAGLKDSFEMVSRCGSYLGNDTGLMHVAASTGIPTMGLFAYPDLMVKNPPFCERSDSVLFTDHNENRIDEIAERFVDFVWGTR